MNGSPVDLNGADALLLVGDSERNADLLWATGFRAPDPFAYVATAESAWVVVKDLELDRAREQVRGAEVLAASRYEAPGDGSTAAGGQLGEILRSLDLRRLLVPSDFPVRTADELRASGFALTISEAPLFPQRAIKSPEEVAAIAQAQEGAERAMEAALAMIGESAIQDDLLVGPGGPLTSEVVRRRIHHVLLDCDCHGEHTIVAGGEQAIDPHQTGHGPLPAHRPIIIDIFPRHSVSGYYGDITRTVVRGRESGPAQRLYETVAAAQQGALESIRDGVDGAEVHAGVTRRFTADGYESGQIDGRMQGFFHGTGHGLGLQIHEAPYIARSACRLTAGQVVTVEPGLYYAGVGGVRIEDLVVVEEAGCRNLTTFPKSLSL